MHLIIADKKASVYSAPDTKTDEITVLSAGQEVAVVEQSFKVDSKFIEICCSSGYGFIMGDVNVYRKPSRIIMEDYVQVLENADDSSEMITCLNKGDKVTILNTSDKSRDKTWVKIFDQNAQIGFISGKTVVKDEVVASDTWLKNMVMGGALFFLGSAVSVASVNFIIGSVTVFYGAVIVGFVFLSRGIIQYLRGEKINNGISLASEVNMEPEAIAKAVPILVKEEENRANQKRSALQNWVVIIVLFCLGVCLLLFCDTIYDMKQLWKHLVLG